MEIAFDSLKSRPTGTGAFANKLRHLPVALLCHRGNSRVLDACDVFATLHCCDEIPLLLVLMLLLSTRFR
jgi:hypothetical protein